MQEQKYVEWAEQIDRLRDEAEDLEGLGNTGRKGNPNVYSINVALEEPRFPRDNGDMANVERALVLGEHNLVNGLLAQDYLRGQKIEEHKFYPETLEDLPDVSEHEVDLTDEDREELARNLRATGATESVVSYDSAVDWLDEFTSLDVSEYRTEEVLN